MVWCEPTGAEKSFTFRDIEALVDKTANTSAPGHRQGRLRPGGAQTPLRVLVCGHALHKLGAVLVPATFMLKAHDVEYRINSARIKAAVVTTACDAADAVDEAATKCPTLRTKIIVRGEREGWDSFDRGVEAASEDFERVETHVHEPMIMYFSSGTSGYPKMVLHDHSYALAHLFTAKHWHNVDPRPALHHRDRLGQASGGNHGQWS